MLIGISNLIDSPKGVILSFVSLKFFKERTDFRRQILASSSQVIQEILLTGTERKFDGLEGRSFGSYGGTVSGLIENGAKIVDGVKENAWQTSLAILD